MACGQSPARAPGKNDLNTKWVYKTKTNSRGDLERLKALFVVCGNEQVLNVNYVLTFSAVMVRLTATVIMALAAT